MNRGQRHTNTRKAADIARRRKIVAANLLAGATYAEIAEVLSVSKATISGDYKAILSEWKQNYADLAEQYVNMQMKRLDVLLNAIWERARSGERDSLDRALAIMDRQNNLMQVGKRGAASGAGVLIFEVSEGVGLIGDS
ncbi:MAG: trp operon repressor [Anaerolineae bacterium]|jgi:hypothetical protein|nr:trp operon repressor [Anaerolineae bacterium]